MNKLGLKTIEEFDYKFISENEKRIWTGYQNVYLTERHFEHSNGAILKVESREIERGIRHQVEVQIRCELSSANFNFSIETRPGSFFRRAKKTFDKSYYTKNIPQHLPDQILAYFMRCKDFYVYIVASDMHIMFTFLLDSKENQQLENALLLTSDLLGYLKNTNS